MGKTIFSLLFKSVYIVCVLMHSHYDELNEQILTEIVEILFFFNIQEYIFIIK